MLDPDQFESFYCFHGSYTTEKDGYTIHWIYITAKIIDRFDGVSVCRLMDGETLVNEIKDSLNPTQLSVLTLLGMSEQEYWQRVQ